MKLSEAIRLGSLAIQNPQKGHVMDWDGSGCAIGMALVATGAIKIGRACRNIEGERLIHKQWPWTVERGTLGCQYLVYIIDTFDTKVAEGKMTLEALCDQVRQWEEELSSKGVDVEQSTIGDMPAKSTIVVSLAAEPESVEMEKVR